MEDIILSARYGLTHKLVYIGNNLWNLQIDPKSAGYFRILGFEGEHEIGNMVSAIDPEGGPFLQVGNKINGKTIKSITRNGILELE